MNDPSTFASLLTACVMAISSCIHVFLSYQSLILRRRDYRDAIVNDIAEQVAQAVMKKPQKRFKGRRRSK